MPADVQPDRVLLTIDIAADGTITCWTASSPDGSTIEDWRLRGRFLDASHSHTWEIDRSAYMVLRDVLRYLGESDWEPDTLM